jgi:hypothetical protein
VELYSTGSLARSDISASTGAWGSPTSTQYEYATPGSFIPDPKRSWWAAFVSLLKALW